MSTRQPTESDSLLPIPSPVTRRKSYTVSQANSSSDKLRRYIITGVSISVLIIFASEYCHYLRHHRGQDNNIQNEQLSVLQHLTEQLTSLPVYTSTHKQSNHPKGKLHELHGHKKAVDTEDNVFHCTSQVMIMRHCEKIPLEKKHDNTIDKHGNRHCSVKGLDRSKYIATLFVDPSEYQDLVEEDNNNPTEDGIPPVAFIKSNGFEGKVSSPSSKQKPQFPTPLKLYALSAGRPRGSKQKIHHENFREIETITPLSDKFNLKVDERYGINQEDELAADFFASLTDNVSQNIQNMKMGVLNDKHSNLCHSGMTIVNWKHSRIPILANALGCGKNEGCPKRYRGDDFDTMWLLTFQYSLLLDGEEDNAHIEDEVETSLLDVTPVSKSLEVEDEDFSNNNLRRMKRKKMKHHGDGKWVVSAELVNEGFEPRVNG